MCVCIFLGYFVLRFGMVSRGHARKYIQFVGGLLLFISLAASFFIVGWVRGLINVTIFWIVVTPVVELAIRYIYKRINAPYEEIHNRIAEKYGTTPDEVRKKIYEDMAETDLGNSEWTQKLSQWQNEAKRRRMPDEYGIYIESAFEIAHRFVVLRDDFDRKAGTAWSMARNLFRKVDHSYYRRGAQKIRDECRLLKDKVETMIVTNMNPSIGSIRGALVLYLDTLYAAIEIYVRKLEFLNIKSKSATCPGTPYHDFQEIVREEIRSLENCQAAGDRLTKIYREAYGVRPGN